MLVLRTCDKDRGSYNGFQWPESGPVEATDWEPTEQCGKGLHGLPWGEGCGALMNWDEGAKWLVVDVPDDSIIDLGGKVKFPKGKVVYCGDRHGATEYIVANGAFGRAVVGCLLTGGDESTLTGGDRSILTGGDESILMFRYWDSECARYRIAVGYIGENGLKPDVKYRLNDKHEFEEVDK